MMPNQEALRDKPTYMSPIYLDSADYYIAATEAQPLIILHAVSGRGDRE
jgi:hypothetical protein